MFRRLLLLAIVLFPIGTNTAQCQVTHAYSHQLWKGFYPGGVYSAGGKHFAIFVNPTAGIFKTMVMSNDGKIIDVPSPHIYKHRLWKGFYPGGSILPAVNTSQSSPTQPPAFSRQW